MEREEMIVIDEEGHTIPIKVRELSCFQDL